MDESLFPSTKLPDCFLDLKYQGPSFDGAMEIVALKNEIAGLEDVIRITAKVLRKHKKIEFKPDDLQVFIEAFEKGSFRKRVKIIFKSIKHLNDYQGALSLAAVILAVIMIIQQQGAKPLKTISPQLMTEIGDQVKIELLKNDDFLKATANIVRPIEDSSDALVITMGDGSNSTTVKHEDKIKFLELVGEKHEETPDEDRIEILQGRINRVDLDATKRHLGFKVNGEGNSIPATLLDELKSSVSRHSLLGNWVEVKVTTMFRKGLREHVGIKSLKKIQQQQIDFVQP